MKYLTCAVVFSALTGSALMGQTLDTSGDSMMSGSFHFRLLEAANFDSNVGDITEAIAVSGIIAFDGAGNYTITNSTYLDSAGVQQTISASGTYEIGANGWGEIVNPISSTPPDSIHGAYAQGIFIGSSTEGYVTNTFIAIPVSPVLTNSTFTGSYQAGLLDFPSGSSADLKNALFEITPNGQGTFGSIALSGQAENQNVLTVNQTVTGATYTFGSDGSVQMTIPTPSGISSTNALFSGSRTMYVSADGNFILGYTPSGYDIFFGMKATGAPSPNAYKGLYYLSALEDGFGDPLGYIDGFYGSLVSDGNSPSPDQIVHERLFSVFYYPEDFEVDDYTTLTTNGDASDFNGYNYAFGDNGNAFVAIGTGGYFSLVAGVHANTFTGSGVFLNPIGLANSASYAPITASLTPGELVTLVGSGLSSTTMTTQGGIPFPLTLGGVQVLVNGTAAPIYYVSPTQISAILPYELATTGAVVASIQVSNNNVMSKAITQYTSDALPGVFSQTANGIGYAAAVHVAGSAAGQLVTPTSPAVAGEYLAVFLTGLGTVTPSVQDGAIGSSNASSLNIADQYTAGNLGVYFDDYNNDAFEPGNINYAGLAPGLAGLYQINVQVPTGVGPGDVYLEVSTDAADVIQIQVPVGSGSAARSRTAAGPVRIHRRPMAARRRVLIKSAARTSEVAPNQLPR